MNEPSCVADADAGAPEKSTAQFLFGDLTRNQINRPVIHSADSPMRITSV